MLLAQCRLHLRKVRPLPSGISAPETLAPVRNHEAYRGAGRIAATATVRALARG